MDSIMQIFVHPFASLFDLFSKLNFFILLPIFFAVGAFLVSYYKHYQQPADRIAAHLARVLAEIRAARFRREPGPRTLENALDDAFSGSPFNSLWTEYCASLHVVHGRDDRKTVLATVPAETYFSKEAVVDLHINADFYRHLPGILTGIGIIGTFSGLVWGLHQFKPDTSDAVSSLPILLQEVTSAFIGSGFAILAAIFVTYKEKSVINRCYRMVNELTREIDSLYATGAGEEYLARLVAAAESQAVTQEKQHQALALQVGAAIREALAEPMAQLAGVVERVSASQEVAISGILDEVLKTFAGRLEDTFTHQIERINESFRRSSEAMDQVRDSMTVLLADMASVGVSGVDQMAGTLAQAVENSSVAQDRMNEQMAAFIDEMRTSLLGHQSQSAEVMDVTMRAVLTKLQSALTRLAADRADQIEQDRLRLETLTDSVARLVASVDESSLRTAESLSVLQNTATGAISGMNNGAVVMRMAADRFAMAGNTLSDALEKADALSGTVENLQELLTSSAQLRRAG